MARHSSPPSFICLPAPVPRAVWVALLVYVHGEHVCLQLLHIFNYTCSNIAFHLVVVDSGIADVVYIIRFLSANMIFSTVLGNF